jgi:hypothetical protein
MGGFFGSIPSVAISDSTVAGRTLLTSSTTQGLRTAIDSFVSAVTLGAFPASGNLQRLYLALDTAKTYVWNGSAYTEVSPNTHIRAGTGNTNVGETALSSASLSGAGNVAVGTDSLKVNTSGAYNTAIGYASLQANQSGGSCVAVGSGALYANIVASTNTAIGTNALAGSNADGNTAVGAGAGSTLISGQANTLVGALSDVDSSNRNYCVVLGSGTISPAVNGSLAIGGAGGNAMGNLVTISGGTNAAQDLIIYLNGTRYRIALKT